MTKFEHHRVREIKENSSFENRLYHLFVASISDQVPITQFRKLFSKYQKMDVHIMTKNGKDIGMAYFMYCKNPNCKKDIYIRIGLGIIEEERASSYFPKSLIMSSMIKAKLKNPLKNVFLVGITMNPIVYSATCKYWKYTYPNPLLVESTHINNVKNRIITLFNMNEVENDVIGVPFKITEVEEVKKKFEENRSENVFINYFTSKIAAEECNKGLLSIIPISFRNLVIVVIRKTKMDVMRSLYMFMYEKVMPMLEEYRPATRI
ncbi:hypothetical protein U6A24_21460 [Aquimarina gracilis]|uniref:Acetyltransferase (GNAT) family protein n=1 Tax=Aquimarina gracilis TaxID=874422 RepID=A0ABU6A1M6_9FLAO|nr:hypothetical protein [Aquimarina gracilis]MEB3348058.1 hypothetical protein [Aquimarina gracilis]